MNMQELLRLQAEYSKDNNRLAKQDRIIQLAQAYQESQIKKDEDLNVRTLKGLDKALRDSVEVQKGLRKDVQDLSKVLKQDTADKDVQESEKSKQNIKELAENLKSLKEVMAQNMKLFIQKEGGGAKMGKEIIAANEQEPPAGKLRKFLFGKQSAEEIQNQSTLGITGALGKHVIARDEKREYNRQKNEYVEAALKSNDAGVRVQRNSAGTKTEEERAEGDKRAKAFAERRFDQIKAEEKKLAAMQKEISQVENAGFNVTKAKATERDEQAEKVIGLDPRRKNAFKEEAKQQIAAATDKEGKEAKIKPADNMKSENQEESDNTAAIFHADSIKAQHEMGATLIQSLDIQKQSLMALTKMAENATGGEDSGGSSALSTAADLASSVGKGGKGKMLGKAAGFLGRHAGKIGAIGGVAMGAYDAYEGWSDASEAEKRGEITHEEANVKKGGAVGKGVGGAGGALAGAAAGAAIGSVVPVVGTAIGGLVGGALGYWGGSKAGEAVGEAGTKAYQGVTNDSSRIDAASANNASLATNKGNQGATLINSNTNNVINNSNSSTPMRSPIRNQESTMSRYIENRYR